MKKDELPKFHETFNPILDILSDGKIIHVRELQNKVIEKYYSHLSTELLDQKTKSGDVLIYNRIAWGKFISGHFFVCIHRIIRKYGHSGMRLCFYISLKNQRRHSR